MFFENGAAITLKVKLYSLVFNVITDQQPVKELINKRNKKQHHLLFYFNLSTNIFVHTGLKNIYTIDSMNQK